MLIAGGLAGLVGATIIQGQTAPLTFNSYGTYGFDGITVALLGRARPSGVVLAGAAVRRAARGRHGHGGRDRRARPTSSRSSRP